MNPVWVTIIGVVLSAVMGGLIAAVGTNLSRIAKMEIQMAILNTQVSPLWARVQSQIASELHQPHERYKEMDKLLEKLEALKITDEERVRLKTLLRERMVDQHPDITEGQRASAKLMIGVMEKVLEEAKVDGDIKDIGLVGSKLSPPKKSD